MSDVVQEAFDKLNSRRHALIVRKLSGGGLDAERLRELDDVTKRCDAVVHALFPLPSIEAVAKQLGLCADARQLSLPLSSEDNGETGGARREPQGA